MAASGPGKFAAVGGMAGGAPNGYLLYNFDPQRAVLKPEHEVALREVIRGLLESGRNRVTLVGRADRSESPGADIGLSMDRAEAVARFLRSIPSLKFPSQNLKVQALGEPFGFPSGPEQDRGVQISVAVDQNFVIGVHKTTRVGGVKWNVVEQVIREGLGPMVEQAGRTLKFSSGTDGLDDVTLNFTDAAQTAPPCQGHILILGMEGGGGVYVNAHLMPRVCNGRTPGEQVFQATDTDLARGLGNTALHELGHILAQLDHTGDISNFLYKGPTGRPGETSLSKQQIKLRMSGPKTWNEEQRRTLIQAIAGGYYSGGARVN